MYIFSGLITSYNTVEMENLELNKTIKYIPNHDQSWCRNFPAPSSLSLDKRIFIKLGSSSINGLLGEFEESVKI